MEDSNHGRRREPGDELEVPTRENEQPSPYRRPGGELSPQDERTWCILSHASVLAWPLTGFLPVAPLILWLIYRDRSPRVGFHALQSLWYQVAWLVLATIGGFLGTVFTLLTLGIGLIVVAPLAVVLGLAPFVHQLYAAYKVGQGEDYRYPVIADRIDGGRRTL
jgi:uncharacterized Tic20 family protein